MTKILYNMLGLIEKLLKQLSIIIISILPKTFFSIKNILWHHKNLKVKDVKSITNSLKQFNQIILSV